MVRKLILGAVAAAAVGFGAQAATAGGPAFAPAGGPAAGHYPPRADFDYVVLVRRGPHHHWERYGRYETLHEARRAERRLEREGFQVVVEEVRDRGW
jgi:hypothetical protein